LRVRQHERRAALRSLLALAALVRVAALMLALALCLGARARVSPTTTARTHGRRSGARLEA
jgi:hypothetical protein